MKEILLFFLAIQPLFAEKAYFPYTEYEGRSEFERYADHLDFIEELLSENPVIFEAGAHYGFDSIRLARQWPKGVILSFEPNPHAFERFCQATRDIPQIHGYPLALNSYNGHAALHLCHGAAGDDPSYEGASSLLEASEYMKLQYQGPEIEVPCVILEDWCRQNQIDHIDFLWLDLEGVELQVLKSSPEILKTVKVIFAETNFRSFRVGMTRFHPLKRFLEKAGFELLAHWYWPGLQGNALFARPFPS